MQNETPEPVLAVGAGLKSAVCILHHDQATMSEHLGDLFNPAAYRNFVRTVDQFERLLDVTPDIIAHDLHPDYMATHYAKNRSQRTLAVQHHHAHVVSAMADNDLQGQVIGITCDGTGYGTDDAIWGCEILVADEAEFTRAAHLDYFPLLGGDAAAQETWRPAAGLLRETFGESWRNEVDATGPLSAFYGAALARSAAGPAPRDPAPRSAESGCDEERLAIAQQRLRNPHRLAKTSSLGRLFDAVAFLLGLCDYNHSEAQAAMTLEAAARKHAACSPWPYALLHPDDSHDSHGPIRIDYRPMIRALLEDLAARRKTSEIARTFHETIIAMLAETASLTATQTGLDRVVFSGGCFANRLLTEGLHERLVIQGFKVYLHQRVPTTDGGIALGQAVCAAERLRRENSCV